MDGNEDEEGETSELKGKGIFIAVLGLLSCILLTLLRSGVAVSVCLMDDEGGIYRRIHGRFISDVYRVQLCGYVAFGTLYETHVCM